MLKPSALSVSEYNPYYKKYIDLVGEVPLIKALQKGHENLLTFFENIPASKLHFRYAENKWTPKDILLHVIDTERVFAYRALFISRADNANLSGFDENVFAENASANEREIRELLEEYDAVRKATISLFKTFDAVAFKNTGLANESILSVGSAGFIICGHEIHHLKIIRERYL